ncbi:MAG: DUF3604 domain-containing protein [Luteitalea sp.]|nr:DUF3604 domain-containing protein [Luteitalea sp.]
MRFLSRIVGTVSSPSERNTAWIPSRRSFMAWLGLSPLLWGWRILPTTSVSGQARDTGVEPRMTVHPRRALAGSHQQVHFELSVGEQPIVAGGGVRIELPVAYLETAPSYWDQPQTNTPEGRGYVRARASNGAKIVITLGGATGGIIECIVMDASLDGGESIEIDYVGIVQSLTWDLAVRVEWRGNAQEPWQSISELPTVDIAPQTARTLFAVAPAELQRDTEFDLAVVLLDQFGNRATGYRGIVTLTSTDPRIELPRPYTFTEADAGVHVFENVKYGTLGFQRIDVTAGELHGRSNYSEVSDALPRLRRYFGESHFHTGSGTNHEGFTTTGAGGDHRGHFTSAEAAYAYLRDVIRLDFGSSAEHDAPAFTDQVWERSQQITDSFNVPGRFTTFFAYEWTAAPSEGHHVIVYPERGGKAFNQRDYPTQRDIWAAFDEQGKPVIMIPHVMWAQPDHRIWSQVSNKYRRVGEIYSLWNNRFLLQPGDEPQRFEEGVDNPWSYQYAWHRGHRIGVIGSSDNHIGHPGANNYTTSTQQAGGLVGVLTSSNTREAIWEALDARRTYATSGVRILLSVTADGHHMGEEYATDQPPQIVVRVAGTNKIQTVEIVKHDSRGYRTIWQHEPDSETGSFEHIDDDFTEDSFYYVRVFQVDEFSRGAWAYPSNEMAWSSPIWVEKSGS